MSDKSNNLVVLGAGAGGISAAKRAAQLGMDVTMVSSTKHPGGRHYYYGEVVRGKLLRLAKTISDVDSCEDFGISFQRPVIDLVKLRAGKDMFIQELRESLAGEIRKHRIKYIQGRARFTSSHSLVIDHTDGSSEEREFENAIIATGSLPREFSSLNSTSPRVMNAEEALNLEDLPDRLLVVGGGRTGIELGNIYCALGSRVTLVEKTNSLMNRADRDLTKILHKELRSRFEGIWQSTTFSGVKVQKNGLKVTLEGKGSEASRKVFDKVIVAIGRMPDTSNLGLNNTMARVDSNGFVKVDRQQRTHDPKIWAVGDVVREPMLAQRARYEGVIAAEVIAGGCRVAEPRAIPQFVNGNPELAWVGMTEIEAKRQDRKIRVITSAWSGISGSVVAERNTGLIKILIDASSRLILGVGIGGEGASDAISEGTLAIEMAANIDDLRQIIHLCPAISEIL